MAEAMQDLHRAWVIGGYVLIVLTGGLALWRGGWAERTAAAIILVAWFLNPFLQSDSYSPSALGLFVDVVVTIALVAISNYSRRLWTVFAAASMLGALICHLAHLFSFPIGRFAYLTIVGLHGGLYLAIALGCGVLEHEHLKRIGFRSSRQRQPD